MTPVRLSLAPARNGRRNGGASCRARRGRVGAIDYGSFAGNRFIEIQQDARDGRPRSQVSGGGRVTFPIEDGFGFLGRALECSSFLMQKCEQTLLFLQGRGARQTKTDC